MRVVDDRQNRRISPEIALKSHCTEAAFRLLSLPIPLESTPGFGWQIAAPFLLEKLQRLFWDSAREDVLRSTTSITARYAETRAQVYGGNKRQARRWPTAVFRSL
jgi:hypothetical protein